MSSLVLITDSTGMSHMLASVDKFLDALYCIPPQEMVLASQLDILILKDRLNGS